MQVSRSESLSGVAGDSGTATRDGCCDEIAYSVGGRGVGILAGNQEVPSSDQGQGECVDIGVGGDPAPVTGTCTPGRPFSRHDTPRTPLSTRPG